MILWLIKGQEKLINTTLANKRLRRIVPVNAAVEFLTLIW